MRTQLLIAFSVASLGVGLSPGHAAAQIFVEGHGDIGYSRVNTVAWLGQGAFDAERLVYGGDVEVLFGRRYGRGLQVGLEFGFQHLLDYKFIVAGQPTPFTAEAYRAGLTTRFWFGEGAWFGEGGFGAYFFDQRTDPSLMAGAGTLIDIGERLAIPLRVRAAVVFGSASQIGPMWFSTGLSYRIRS